MDTFTPEDARDTAAGLDSRITFEMAIQAGPAAQWSITLPSGTTIEFSDYGEMLEWIRKNPW
jgi:hypothetical protein